MQNVREGDVLMPMDRKRYPKDWKQIAFEVKQEAGWKCEECGVQCYRPGQRVTDHGLVLTVAHLNHTPEDCRRENLRALCARCHLRYDVGHHRESMVHKGTNQMSLGV